MQTVNHGIILQRACFPCITRLYKALNRLFFLLIDQSDQDSSTALVIIVPTIGPSIFFSLIFLSSPHSLFFSIYVSILTLPLSLLSFLLLVSPLFSCPSYPSFLYPPTVFFSFLSSVSCFSLFLFFFSLPPSFLPARSLLSTLSTVLNL